MINLVLGSCDPIKSSFNSKSVFAITCQSYSYIETSPAVTGVIVPGRGGGARLRAAVRDAEPGGARARIQRGRRAALRREARLGRRARRGR